MEADLRSIRLDLFEEMDRRKKAEDAVEHLQNMFQRMAEQLSPASASAFSLSRPGGEEPLWDANSAAQFCQEVIVTRVVSEALERGLAQAEAEAAAEAAIEAKSHEIARLRDRVQYYEAVNQEMSQRNQEAIGMNFEPPLLVHSLFLTIPHPHVSASLKARFNILLARVSCRARPQAAAEEEGQAAVGGGLRGAVDRRGGFSDGPLLPGGARRPPRAGPGGGAAGGRPIGVTALQWLNSSVNE